MYISAERLQHAAVTHWKARWPVAASVALAAQLARAESAAQPEVPAHNRPKQAQPPPRPPAADAEAKARALFDAIARDDPRAAADVFFPRAAFLLVKAIRDPGRYYDRLQRRFESDIHELHRRLRAPKSAEFVRFELANRGGYVREGEEGNRLPYWASRHSWLHFRDAGKLERFEVRVLITWDDRWYVIHLNEFR